MKYEEFERIYQEYYLKILTFIHKRVPDLYEPWEGEILYDGKKITEIPRESFSGSLSVVEIARAIVTKPKVLLFDEATSALDNITQKHVSDSLKNLKSTRIVIAHRLSTIKECDRIIVLDKGHIIEDGTYQSLSKAGVMRPKGDFLPYSVTYISSL